jgi:GMP synthase-like glutamine amidotransferase
VRRVHAGDPVPASPDRLDGLVVMGGPMSAASDDGFATRRAELELIGAAVEAQIPTLGVCLGAQLLALAAGGEVVAGSAGAEVGWAPIRISDDAGSDPLFAGLPPSLRVLHWHRDTYELPAGAVRLASSDRYPQQAFRVGDDAWGLQFHVEVDAAAVVAFVAAFTDEAALGGGAEAILGETPAALTGLEPQRRLLLGRFAARVSAHASRSPAAAAR